MQGLIRGYLSDLFGLGMIFALIWAFLFVTTGDTGREMLRVIASWF